MPLRLEIVSTGSVTTSWSGFEPCATKAVAYKSALAVSVQLYREAQSQGKNSTAMAVKNDDAFATRLHTQQAPTTGIFMCRRADD